MGRSVKAVDMRKSTLSTRFIYSDNAKVFEAEVDENDNDIEDPRIHAKSEDNEFFDGSLVLDNRNSAQLSRKTEGVPQVALVESTGSP